VLQDLADSIIEFMIESGEDPLGAATIGMRIAEHVREHWGGQKIYIPKACSYYCFLRDQEIFDKWNGSNTKELCNEYAITNTRLYQIIVKVRQERKERKAPSQTLIDQAEPGKAISSGEQADEKRARRPVAFSEVRMLVGPAFDFKGRQPRQEKKSGGENGDRDQG
jgi:Mor family transcriptional regulator